ncbi:DNA-binding transcriptional LysR family regulator [Pseudochelatococcus lubricantis]|uniref:DNA-binding transcriptional LysR family regulator n=1 Tax=Pseudochelatococcus lubricantis TaxID=1538102 RepID=A0ABX0V4F0_9HYPH|nr:LysR substrate-binding domain-containing protein [Pseudochelatococcus lubricantis]NIJ59992.1 DNA-binding transcriptional LysR family regulator [Pseudochelatococcus lubricantis]
MELRHLRYFVTLAEELHFARAAERLNIAPPTLTVQIQEIERTLSARLFVRTKRSVTLTPAGEIFLAEARNVLEQYARAESAGRRAGRGEIGRVEIGYVGSAAYAGVLQDQTSRFRLSWPGVHLDAREFPMDELPGLVADGHVDIGFVRLPMVLPRELKVHVLLRDYFCLALPGGHPEAGETRPLRPALLAGEALIAPEQQAGTYEVARRGRFAPRIVSSPGSLLAVLTQVSLGTGISVIPGIVRDIMHMPNVVFRPVAGEPIPSEVAAVFRAAESAPTVKTLIRQIVQSPAIELDAGDR